MRTLAAALTALAPLLAAAQPVSAPSGPDTYLSFHAGAYVPQHDDLRSYDPGIAFGGTFGALFTPNVGVEGEVAYYRVDGADAARLWAIPLTASLRLRLPLKVAEVSALAGGGAHFVTRSLRVRLPGVPAVDASEHDTAFAFHAGAAAALNLSPTMLVGAEVRRTVVPARFGGGDVRLDGLRIALTLSYRM